MKHVFLVLLALQHFAGVAQQVPSQETFNQQMTAVMMAYPQNFSSLRGEDITDQGGESYLSTLQFSGTARAYLSRHWENKPDTDFALTLVVVDGVSQFDAMVAFLRWRNLLKSCELNGARLKEIALTGPNDDGDMKSEFNWDTPGIAKEYKYSPPILFISSSLGNTFRVEVIIRR